MKLESKKTIAFACAILTLFTFAACNKTDNALVAVVSETNTQTSISENNEIPIVSITQLSPQIVVDNDNQLNENNEQMPEPFEVGNNIGGDDNTNFYQPCISQLDSIPGSLLDIRPSNEVDDWLNKHFSREYAVSSIADYLNVYSFITDFNVTKEEAAVALESYINSEYESVRITQEQFDIIFSGDIELITKTFASEYSIVIGENIYSPEWVYTHSKSDYAAVGLSMDEIIQKAPMYASLNLSGAARNALSDKLSSYTGVEINIEPVQSYSENPTNFIIEEVAIEEDVDSDYDNETPVNIDEE